MVSQQQISCWLWATQKEDIRDTMILYWSVWKLLFSKLHHNILPVDTRGQKYSEHEPFLCMYTKLFHKQWVRNWGTYPRRKEENNDLKCFAHFFFFYCLTFCCCCRCSLSYHHQKSPSVSSHDGKTSEKNSLSVEVSGRLLRLRTTL